MNRSGPAFWPEVGAKGIPTYEFLGACDVVVQCFGAIGTVLAPVKSDVERNINKLRNVYNTNPVKYEFLQDMIRFEKVIEGSMAPGALLWLKRGLHFIFILMDSVVKDVIKREREPEIKPHYRASYNRALRKYHPWPMQNICILCINAGLMPNCRVLLLACCRNSPDDTPTSDLATRLKPTIESLRSNLIAIIAFYHAEGLDTVAAL